MDPAIPETRPDTAAPRISAARVQSEYRKTADESRGSISTGRWMWEWTKAICTAILLFLGVRTFLVEAFKIPTGSMEGTLLVGDFLLVNKAVYGAEIPGTHMRLPAFSHPRRGDVVVFLPPHEQDRNYVKRIVGVPGDTLRMVDKVLYVNGEPQVEPYARHVNPLYDDPNPSMRWQADFLIGDLRERRAYHPTRDNWGPLVVPPNKYFALGDNRDNSEDSRYWGFVDADAVRGRPILVYYSFDKDIAQPLGCVTCVRWDRIGSFIH
jgi:signal peptidase I